MASQGDGLNCRMVIRQILAARIALSLAGLRTIKETEYTAFAGRIALLIQHHCRFFVDYQVGWVAATGVINHSLIAAGTFMKDAALWFIPHLCAAFEPPAIHIQRTSAELQRKLGVSQIATGRTETEDWFPRWLQRRSFVAVPSGCSRRN